MRVYMHTLILISIFFTQTSADQARFPRHPAPSPRGTQIAFSWQGDIWIVGSTGGTARRMTVHPAADRFPVWSSDGSMIAFASLRHGQYDIFILSADGSEPPRRLTYASSYDIPCDFSGDGEAIIFSSHRTESVRSLPGLYAVPVTGGTPYLFQEALGRHISFSPHGSTRLFVRGKTRWTRSGYRGSGNREIWLWSDSTGYEKITEFSGDDDCPDWIDDSRICFLSSRSGRKNIYTRDLETGTVEQITNHTESDARFPRISADGSLIAYEFNDHIRLISPQNMTTGILTIDVPLDYAISPTDYRCETRNAGEIAVHPDGSCIALTVRGNIFIVELLGEEEREYLEPRTRQITATPAEEKDLSWSPSGDELLYTSDRNGNDDVFILRTQSDAEDWFSAEQFTEECILESEEDDYAARFSPDGTTIAFLRNRGDIGILDLAGKCERILAESWLPPDFQWSPDSRYITYAMHDESYNQDVWIAGIDGTKFYNLSRHPDSDHSPRWSPDGKRIIWVSRRHQDTHDIWGTWLSREDSERTERSWFEYWQTRKETDGPENSNNGEPIPIDFDDLWERTTHITRLPGSETNPEFVDDGSLIAFTAEQRGEHDLYTVRWDGSELNRITTGDVNPQQICGPGTSGSIILRTDTGMIYHVSLDGNESLPVRFEACFSVNTVSEHDWVFKQVWRSINKWYYDPTFHGVDWDDQYARYEDLARCASTEEDFEDAVDLMLGELNSSHMNYRSPGTGEELQAGWIGIHCAPPDGDPGILIENVIPDTPASRLDVDLQAGDRIIAIDGLPMDTNSNIFRHLTGKTGKDVRLRILDRDGDERSAILIPVTRRDINRALYDHWVSTRRTMTADQSDGNIGYIHIRSMNENSFEEFETALYAAGNQRSGLIIDVRSNGGGWITDYLLTSLMVERHSYTRPRGYRGNAKAYPQVRLPFAAWTKPALVLCNEESFSNAEIFAHAFKALNRGMLIGTPTFGGVISTGRMSLINGGTIRIPRRGWFDATTGGDLENNGAKPHEIVNQPPESDCSMTEDAQLEYAIHRFMSTIEGDPRFGNW